jgi:hypothetical protein
MADQQSSSEARRVTMDVGTRGILGGQGKVNRVQGTWADLTNNDNVSRIDVMRLAEVFARQFHET